MIWNGWRLKAVQRVEIFFFSKNRIRFALVFFFERTVSALTNSSSRSQ